MDMLAWLVHIVLLAAALLLALPVSVLWVQLMSACLGARKNKVPQAQDVAGARPRVAVLVPAHDEAGGIAATLHGLRSQLAAGDTLLVVADNCSDDTAGIAARAGASVVERHDAERRGKGYALDFGVRHLSAQPPEVVVIVDADCSVAPGGIHELARLALQSGRPVQALYRMLPPPQAGLRQRIAAFAWIVKNKLRPLGGARLGWPCQLMGTGMAFDWHAIEHAALASGNIVEDMQLGIDLALVGRPPLFAPQVEVLSHFPTSDAAAAGQRTRWEHGHLATLAMQAPRLLSAALRRRDGRLLGLALDLCVPPLALLALLCSALTGAAALLFAWRELAAPLLFAAALLLMFAVAIGIAWRRDGRALLGAPLYALAKLPIYLRFMLKRQASWVRTRRHGE